MPLPEPVPALVIRYSYLWADEHRQGRQEGRKDRPCAIILVTATRDQDRVVTVLPITHNRRAILRWRWKSPPRPSTASASTTNAPGSC